MKSLDLCTGLRWTEGKCYLVGGSPILIWYLPPLCIFYSRSLEHLGTRRVLMICCKKKPWSMRKNFLWMQKTTNYTRKLVKVLVPPCTGLSAFHLMRLLLSRFLIWKNVTMTWYVCHFFTGNFEMFILVCVYDPFLLFAYALMLM